MAHIHTSGQMQHRHSCAWLALWHAFDERGSVFTASLPTPGLSIRVPLLTDTHTYPLAFRPLVWFHGGGFVPPLRRHFFPPSCGAVVGPATTFGSAWCRSGAPRRRSFGSFFTRGRGAGMRYPPVVAAREAPRRHSSRYVRF